MASRLRRKVYPELASGHFIFLLLIGLWHPVQRGLFIYTCSFSKFFLATENHGDEENHRGLTPSLVFIIMTRHLRFGKSCFNFPMYKSATQGTIKNDLQIGT